MLCSLVSRNLKLPGIQETIIERFLDFFSIYRSTNKGLHLPIIRLQRMPKKINVICLQIYSCSVEIEYCSQGLLKRSSDWMSTYLSAFMLKLEN